MSICPLASPEDSSLPTAPLQKFVTQTTTQKK